MNILKQNNIRLSLAMLLFGIMTIFAGGKALFTDIGMSTRGNIIPLVLWFNFVAGFTYVVIGILVSFKKKIALRFTAILSSLNVAVLFYLLNHIANNGAYETRTLVAMSFRTVFWFGCYIFLSRNIFYQDECGCG